MNKKAAILALIAMCVSVDAPPLTQGPSNQDNSSGTGNESEMTTHDATSARSNGNEAQRRTLEVENLIRSMERDQIVHGGFLGTRHAELLQDLKVAYKEGKKVDAEVEELEKQMKIFEEEHGTIEQLEEKLAAAKKKVEECQIRTEQWKKIMKMIAVEGEETGLVSLGTAMQRIQAALDEAKIELMNCKARLETEEANILD